MDVQIYPIHVVEASPLGHLLSHRLRGLLWSQPGPGVLAVGNTSDGKQDPGVRGDSALHISAPGGSWDKSNLVLVNESFEITELYERLGHSHSLWVDIGEEEDVGSLLLEGMESRFPTIIFRVVTKYRYECLHDGFIIETTLTWALCRQQGEGPSLKPYLEAQLPPLHHQGFPHASPKPHLVPHPSESYFHSRIRVGLPGRGGPQLKLAFRKTCPSLRRNRPCRRCQLQQSSERENSISAINLTSHIPAKHLLSVTSENNPHQLRNHGGTSSVTPNLQLYIRLKQK